MLLWRWHRPVDCVSSGVAALLRRPQKTKGLYNHLNNARIAFTSCPVRSVYMYIHTVHTDIHIYSCIRVHRVDARKQKDRDQLGNGCLSMDCAHSIYRINIWPPWKPDTYEGDCREEKQQHKKKKIKETCCSIYQQKWKRGDEIGLILYIWPIQTIVVCLVSQ